MRALSATLLSAGNGNGGADANQPQLHLLGAHSVFVNKWMKYISSRNVGEEYCHQHHKKEKKDKNIQF